MARCFRPFNQIKVFFVSLATLHQLGLYSTGGAFAIDSGQNFIENF